jgi:predicted RNase H-like HicB family nuclease
MASRKNYSIQIRKGIFSEEECYQATVLEFPDLHEYADSHAEVYDLIIDSIETTLEILAEKSRPAPSPMTVSLVSSSIAQENN